MTDRAAAMTYYVMMSLFPALLVAVSLLGLLGDPVARHGRRPLRAASTARRPRSPTRCARRCETTIESAGGAVSSALVLGIVVAIYGASGAFGGAGPRAEHGLRRSRDARLRRSTSSPTSRGRSSRWRSRSSRCSRSSSAAGSRDDLFGTIGLGDTAAADLARRALVRRDRGGAADVRDHVLVRAGHQARGACAGSRPGAAAGVAIWLAGVGRLLLLRRRTSASTARRTARSPARSSCCCGCTSRASRSSSAPSSTPSTSASSGRGRATRRRRARSRRRRGRRPTATRVTTAATSTRSTGATRSRADRAPPGVRTRTSSSCRRRSSTSSRRRRSAR